MQVYEIQATNAYYRVADIELERKNDLIVLQSGLSVLYFRVEEVEKALNLPKLVMRGITLGGQAGTLVHFMSTERLNMVTPNAEIIGSFCLPHNKVKKLRTYLRALVHNLNLVG